MLTGAGFGDDARLAHALCEKDLADAIVDLVCAGVVELLALEIDFRAAEMARQPFREIERAGPADIMFEKAIKLGGKFGVVLGRFIGFFELQQQRHQGFGNITSAEGAEMSARIGAEAKAVGGKAHVDPVFASAY